jgi:hypothetical protein
MPEPARIPQPVAAPATAPALAPVGPLTTADQVLSLSRTAGNQAVVRMLGREPAPGAAAPAAPAAPSPPVDRAAALSSGPLPALLTAVEGWSPREEWLQAHIATPGADVARLNLADRIVFHKQGGAGPDAAVEVAQDLYVVGASTAEKDAVFRYLGLSGLALPSNLEAFASDAKGAAAAIAAMSTFGERAEKVRGVINARLAAAGVPAVTAVAPGGGGNAHFAKESWSVTVDPTFAMQNGANGPAELLATVYHEARHAEQDFLVARHMARTKEAEQIAAEHGIPLAVAQAAKASPLPADDPQAGLVERLRGPQPDDGPDPELAKIRPRLIEKKQKGEAYTAEEKAILDRAYQRYKNRPNEADAFLIQELAQQQIGLTP